MSSVRSRSTFVPELFTSNIQKDIYEYVISLKVVTIWKDCIYKLVKRGIGQ